MKNVIGLEVVISGKSHVYICAPDASFIEIKEALFQIQKQVAIAEDMQKSNQESPDKKSGEDKQEEAKNSDVPPEV